MTTLLSPTGRVAEMVAAGVVCTESEAARAAELWLSRLRARMPKPQGLKYTAGPTPKRDAGESPFILALRSALSSADLQQIRYEAGQHIVKLSGAAGR